MRYIISGLLAGLLVGALTPMSLVFGALTCNEVDVVNVSQNTCCTGCSMEDSAWDDVTNDGGDGGTVCISLTDIGNDKSIVITPCDCEFLSNNETETWTVFLERENRCEVSSFDTIYKVGAETCDTHGHTFNQLCGPCP